VIAQTIANEEQQAIPQVTALQKTRVQPGSRPADVGLHRDDYREFQKRP
jgi:hypothetical protein